MKVSLYFPPPHSSLSRCVVVPARDEEKRLPRLIEALAGQRDLSGKQLPAESYEVLVLLNNCSDGSSAVAHRLQQTYPRLCFHVAEVSYGTADAHVGIARRALFETAFRRLAALGKMDGLILTTDADSRPAPDWIAQNEAEIAHGAEGVGGRVVLEPNERAALSPGVRRLFLLDIGYRRALEEMRALYAPEACDPFPRHHQHFGASLCVTAAAYDRAGGMPPRHSNEDVALYRAIVASGGRFRHSNRVQVFTSARTEGRAQGGLADAIIWWGEQVRQERPVLVEGVEAAERRLALLGQWNLDHPTGAAPAHLWTTPDPPPAHEAAEIHATLCALRVRIETLRSLSLRERLSHLPELGSEVSELASLAV